MQQRLQARTAYKKIKQLCTTVMKKKIRKALDVYAIKACGCLGGQGGILC